MSASIIEPVLLESLEKKPTVTVIVTMNEKTTAVLESLEKREFADRGERLNAVNEALRNHAAGSQKSVLEFLEKEKEKAGDSPEAFTFTSLHISNQIIVRNAKPELVRQLATLEGISKIEEDKIIPLLTQ